MLLLWSRLQAYSLLAFLADGRKGLDELVNDVTRFVRSAGKDTSAGAGVLAIMEEDGKVTVADRGLKIIDRRTGMLSEWRPAFGCKDARVHARTRALGTAASRHPHVSPFPAPRPQWTSTFRPSWRRRSTSCTTAPWAACSPTRVPCGACSSQCPRGRGACQRTLASSIATASSLALFDFFRRSTVPRLAPLRLASLPHCAAAPRWTGPSHARKSSTSSPSTT